MIFRAQLPACILFAALFSSGCQAQADPCFEILPVTNPASGFGAFDRTIDVLGVLDIYAEPGVSDAKLLHVATITAELLDNNEDGILDHTVLCDQLAGVDAFMPIFSNEGSPAEDELFDNFDEAAHCASAVLYAGEVSPENPADWFEEAVVEEVLHTINHCGHVPLYPAAFSLSPGSSALSEAMDVARGGQFTSIPSTYPEAAWYHYDDNTCDYECMAIEYLYWCTVSHMGLLDDPQICNAISNEWEPCSPVLFAATDVLASALITDPDFGIPLNAPDGVYCSTTDVVSPLLSGQDVGILAWSPSPGTLTAKIQGLPQQSLNLSLNMSSTLQVYSSSGALLYNGGETHLKLEGLATGTYFVHCASFPTVKVLVH